MAESHVCPVCNQPHNNENCPECGFNWNNYIYTKRRERGVLVEDYRRRWQSGEVPSPQTPPVLPKPLVEAVPAPEEPTPAAGDAGQGGSQAAGSPEESAATPPESAEQQSRRGDLLCAQRDFAKAELWYRKAAEQGLAAAQARLGLLLYQQLDGDDAEAAEWCRQAASQGDADAQVALGIMHLEGRGVERNEAEATRWFRKAAEQGFVHGQALLGLMYGLGAGVMRNDPEALHWLRAAEAQGSTEAKAWLDGVAQRHT